MDLRFVGPPVGTALNQRSKPESFISNTDYLLDNWAIHY